MYPRSFHYHRASSLKEAATLLSDLGEEARPLAGGQSLIPLMKLRFANPSDLVDLNFIPGLSYIKQDGDTFCFGPLARHAEIEHSEIAARIPIIHDCAAGIADVQVRNRGTMAGSLAEADPSGDWAPVLLTLETQVRSLGPKGERLMPLAQFIQDAYTTVLDPGELISEIVVKAPPRNSGGAYLGFKRCAPVYPSAAVAVQLTMEDGLCREARIYLSAVGLTPIRAGEAEAALAGRPIDPQTTHAAAEAARAAADPQPDMRGSVEFKRQLIFTLTQRALEAAARRARGEHVEASHIYA
jgi:aerobic carbon-monoxide dehydrogenase medium subunit